MSYDSSEVRYDYRSNSSITSFIAAGHSIGLIFILSRINFLLDFLAKNKKASFFDLLNMDHSNGQPYSHP